jgi:hypothetical protein
VFARGGCPWRARTATEVDRLMTQAMGPAGAGSIAYVLAARLRLDRRMLRERVRLT